MARLTPSQWLSVRTMWEASPNPGLAWMVKANGGPWDVTTEAIRRRRLAEGWRKHASARGGAGAADVGCWAEGSGREEPGPRGGPFEPVGGLAGLDPAGDLGELCDQLLVQHRRDWLAYRGLLSAAVAEGGTEGVRRAKALGETIRGMQAGEREAFGLVAELLDFDAMTPEQLDGHCQVAGLWPERAGRAKLVG